MPSVFTKLCQLSIVEQPTHLPKANFLDQLSVKTLSLLPSAQLLLTLILGGRCRAPPHLSTSDHWLLHLKSSNHLPVSVGLSQAGPMSRAGLTAHVPPPTVGPLLSRLSAPSHSACCSRSSYTAHSTSSPPPGSSSTHGGHPGPRRTSDKVPLFPEHQLASVGSTQIQRAIPLSPSPPLKVLKSKTQMFICSIQ